MQYSTTQFIAAFHHKLQLKGYSSLFSAIRMRVSSCAIGPGLSECHSLRNLSVYIDSGSSQLAVDELRYLVHILETLPCHVTNLQIAIGVEVRPGPEEPQPSFRLWRFSKDVPELYLHIDELLVTRTGVQKMMLLVMLRVPTDAGFESREQDGESFANTLFPMVAEKKVLSVRMYAPGWEGDDKRLRDVETIEELAA